MIPALPPFARSALLLDVDGTLLDFAPTPEAVIVPPDLLETLGRLRDKLGGALAMISGRPAEQVDALFPGVAQAVAGEHGAAVRPAPGAAITRASLPAVPANWLATADRVVRAHAGARLERKARGFVVHYRAVPEAGPLLGSALQELVSEDPGFELMPASMAWEFRPLGVDKGAAVTALMLIPPFAGRLPVFVGDDVTDHDGIRAAQALGGAGLLVADTFGTPAEVRAFLANAAQRGGW